MGNVAEGLHFFRKLGKFFYFLEDFNEIWPKNVQLSPKYDGRIFVGFGYVFDLKKSDAQEIVGWDSRISVPPALVHT